MLKFISTSLSTHHTRPDIESESLPPSKKAKHDMLSSNKLLTIVSSQELIEHIHNTSLMVAKTPAYLSLALFSPTTKLNLPKDICPNYCYPITTDPTFLNQFHLFQPDTYLFSSYELSFFHTPPNPEDTRPLFISRVLLLLSQKFGTLFCIPNFMEPGFRIETDCQPFLNSAQEQGITCFSISSLNIMEHPSIHDSTALPVFSQHPATPVSDFSSPADPSISALNTLISFWKTAPSSSELAKAILYSKLKAGSDEAWAQGFKKFYVPNNTVIQSNSLPQLLLYLASHANRVINQLGLHTLLVLNDHCSPLLLASHLCFSLGYRDPNTLIHFISSQAHDYAASNNSKARHFFSHMLNQMFRSPREPLQEAALDTFTSLLMDGYDSNTLNTAHEIMTQHHAPILLVSKLAGSENPLIRDFTASTLTRLLQENLSSYLPFLDSLAHSENKSNRDTAAITMVYSLSLVEDQSVPYQYYTPLFQRYYYSDNIYTKMTSARYRELLETAEYPTKTLQSLHKIELRVLKDLLNPTLDFSTTECVSDIHAYPLSCIPPTAPLISHSHTQHESGLDNDTCLHSSQEHYTQSTASLPLIYSQHDHDDDSLSSDLSSVTSHDFSSNFENHTTLDKESLDDVT